MMCTAESLAYKGVPRDDKLDDGGVLVDELGNGTVGSRSKHIEVFERH